MYMAPAAITLMLLAGWSAGLPGEEPATGLSDLAGVYECEGIRGDGESYRGIVEIVRREGTYWMRWTLSPAEQYVGIAVVNGDSLAVSYFGVLPGVAVYSYEEGGDSQRLVGTWTVVGARGATFSETLTKVGDAIEASELPVPSYRPPASPPPGLGV
jgi:hypothetical protein